MAGTKKELQEFAKRWKDRGYEKGESVQFWIELQDALGYPYVHSTVYEHHLDNGGFVIKGDGALGSPIRSGSVRNCRQAAIISSAEGFLSKETLTAAICPSDTGTRRHCALMTGSAALMISSPEGESVPHTFRGSCSLFSSSPPI